MHSWKRLEDGVVSWEPDGGGPWVTIEYTFDLDGSVLVPANGPDLPSWLVEELEQSEAEDRNERRLGDAWSGGFAKNH